MQISIHPDPIAWAQAAALEVAHQIQSKPASVLGLATGKTTVSLHATLARLVLNAAVDFSSVTAFALDEYIGLERGHPASCYARLEAQLFSLVNISKANTYFPDTHANSLAAECQAYERRIQHAGGIDLQIVGIGANGHIGFNEPGTPFESLTHVAQLAPETRALQSQTFGSLDGVPQQGLTLGLKTIMRAHKIVLLGWGGHKREIIGQALLGPVTPEIPASVLQLHPNLLVILDEAAAGALATADQL